jgi:hypothetical protein
LTENMAARRTILVAALAALGLLTAGTSLAGATAARTLGKTNRVPAPSCPGTDTQDCQAVGSVSGFQLIGDGTRPLFKARQNSWLVAWAIDLSKPKKDESSFFGDFYQSEAFGTAPTARVSVLHRKDGRNYKLKAQSPVVGLNSVLGTRQTFALTDPLKMRKGEFLALSIPTWAPSFAFDLTGPTNIWRSSRDEGKCGTQSIKSGKPQQNVGSTREYACDYRGARLLYWGYYVPRGNG